MMNQTAVEQFGVVSAALSLAYGTVEIIRRIWKVFRLFAIQFHAYWGLVSSTSFPTTYISWTSSCRSEYWRLSWGTNQRGGRKWSQWSRAQWTWGSIPISSKLTCLVLLWGSMDEYCNVNGFQQDVIWKFKFRWLHWRRTRPEAKEDQSVQVLHSSSLPEIQGVVE